MFYIFATRASKASIRLPCWMPLKALSEAQSFGVIFMRIALPLLLLRFSMLVWFHFDVIEMMLAARTQRKQKCVLIQSAFHRIHSLLMSTLLIHAWIEIMVSLRLHYNNAWDYSQPSFTPQQPFVLSLYEILSFIRWTGADIPFRSLHLITLAIIKVRAEEKGISRAHWRLQWDNFKFK